ncbi:MAG: AAA family ATPase [Oscillospiraceae bacterium]|nr:AAA family ATPase [Oscillospiraceae bacterium]
MSSSLPDVSQWLTYDPRWMDPKQSSGFWLCTDPADVLSIQINAGCLSAGSTWEDLGRCETFFSRFPYVLLVCPDKARREVLVREARQRLPNTVLLVAEDKAFRGCATVQELRDTYGLKAVDRILLEVRELPICGLLDLADVRPPDVAGMERVVSGISNLDRHIGGFYMGEVSVWTGKRGEGKSTLLDQLLIEAVDQDIPVCAYSGELPAWKFKYWASLQAAGPSYVQTQRDKVTGRELPAATPFAQERIDEWWRGRFHVYDIGSSTTHDAESILRVFRYANRRYGSKVFLVDNLMTARFRYGRERDFYRAQSDFVSELVSFAKSTASHVHLVAHPRKTDRIDDSDAVAGIADVTNLADNVFSLERDSAPESKQDSVLTILKNRFFGERQRSIGLNFDRLSKRFYKSGTGDPRKRYGWEYAYTQISLPDEGPPLDDPFEGR